MNKEVSCNKVKINKYRYGYRKMFSMVIKNTNLTDRFVILVGILCCFISSGLYPTAVWLYGKIVNIIVNYAIASRNPNNLNSTKLTDVHQETNNYIIYYVIFGLPVFLSHFLAYVCFGFVGERVCIRLRSLLYKTLANQEMSWYDLEYRHEQTLNLFNSIDILKLGISEKFCDLIVLSLRALACYCFSFYSVWKLAFAFSGTFLLSIVFFMLTIQMTRKYVLKETQLNNKATNLLYDTLSSLKTVVAFNGQAREIAKYNKLTESLGILLNKKGLILGLTSGLSNMFSNGGYVIYVGYGTYLQTYESNTFNAGLIMQCFSSFLLASVAVCQAFPFVKEFGEAKYASERILNIFKLTKANTKNQTEKKRIILEKNYVKGDIMFRNLTFSYPARPEIKVIESFNLYIKAGCKVAIIGKSGSGKSSIVKLLSKIYEPQNGKICYDNYDINSLDVNWWRDQISIVSQDSIVFKMSLKENIKLVCPNATDEQILDAVKQAQIDNLILNKESFKQNGIETIIEHDKLSGGQRQLISLARAFLKNTHSDVRLLVFDEATSALDNESEEIIRQTLHKLTQTNTLKTMIIIAHRPSTIKNCDLIVEIDGGKLVNMGAYDEMLEKSAYFNKMINNARKSNEEGDDYEISHEINDITLSVDKNKDELPNYKQKPKSYASRIWKLNKPKHCWIILGAVAYFLQGCLYPFIAYCFTEMVRLFIVYNDNISAKMNQSYILTSIVLSITLLTFVSVFFQYFAPTKASTQLTSSVKKLLFKSVLLDHELIWFETKDNNTSLVYGITSNAPLLKSYIIDRLNLLMNSISGLGIPIGICLYYNWKLTLVIATFIPLALFWGFMQGQLFRGHAYKAKGKRPHEEAIRLTDYTIRNIHTLKTLNLDVYFQKKLDQLFWANFKTTLLMVNVEGFFYSLGYILYFFTQCATFSYGTYLLSKNEIEAHNIVRIFVSLLCSTTFVAKNVSLMPDMPKAKQAAKWIFSIFDSERQIEKSVLKKNIDLNGSIVFDRVNFSFNKSSEQVLKDVSLIFEKGSSIALVGQSGSGKSTIVSLIEAFYRPDNGKILINNTSINEIDHYWLRSKIGLVSQEPVMFSGTIKENIIYGLNEQEVTLQDVINAAKQANINDFISNLPQGYDTEISNSNIKLSGGQKQRIAIARALVRKPKILILDEATSSLDIENEQIVQQTIDTLMKSSDLLIIIIAHRLSTIINCDKIYVMKKGQVIEVGNHADLINKRGYYCRLANI